VQLLLPFVKLPKFSVSRENFLTIKGASNQLRASANTYYYHFYLLILLQHVGPTWNCKWKFHILDGKMGILFEQQPLSMLLCNKIVQFYNKRFNQDTYLELSLLCKACLIKTYVEHKKSLEREKILGFRKTMFHFFARPCMEARNGVNKKLKKGFPSEYSISIRELLMIKARCFFFRNTNRCLIQYYFLKKIGQKKDKVERPQRKNSNYLCI